MSKLGKSASFKYKKVQTNLNIFVAQDLTEQIFKYVDPLGKTTKFQKM